MKNVAMLRYALLGFFVIGFLALPNASLAQGSSSATGSASAEIVQPISLTENQALDFGTLARANTAGTATVTPGGALSTTGDVQKLGGHSRSRWTARGEPNATFDIMLPPDGTVDLFKLGGTGVTMGVTNFVTTPLTTGTFNTSGALSISLGATLGLAANQETGMYTGTYPVSLAYN